MSLLHEGAGSASSFANRVIPVGLMVVGCQALEDELGSEADLYEERLCMPYLLFSPTRVSINPPRVTLH